MDEIWKDIEGYEGDYQVSNLGRVKSLPKKCWNGKGYWFKDGRILIPVKSKKGYLNVWCRKNIFKVHRLVANAFIPNPQNLPQVNHIDGDKTNNCVTNLEWVTDGENLLHAYRVLGRRQKIGKNHHNSRAVLQLKDGKIINSFDSLNEAARTTGAHHSGISMCCSGKIKKHKGYHGDIKKRSDFTPLSLCFVSAFQRFFFLLVLLLSLQFLLRCGQYFQRTLPHVVVTIHHPTQLLQLH